MTDRISPAAHSRVFEIDAYFLVMFKHPAIGEWRTWGSAPTGEAAEYRMAEAQEERPEYEFRLAVKRMTKEWL